MTRKARGPGGVRRGWITEEGYRFVYAPDHPRSHSHGYVLEHIVVAERKYGRRITPGEHVHHINGDRADNRPENLEVLAAGEHMRRHHRKWTRAALLDAMRWLAIRLGHTPTIPETNELAGRSADAPYHMHFYRYFGSMVEAQSAAGLTPNGVGSPGHGSNDLPDTFRHRFQHLRRYERIEDMLADLHDGLPTQHERERGAA